MNLNLPKLKTTWIAAGILIAAFVFSAVRFYHVSRKLSADAENDGVQTIRVAHWQLEPGFRESLQWVIDNYNELPHVKAENIHVVQTPIPERVYNQFMNVHLISGTAPDIAVRGKTELVRGNALAKFYAPIGSYVDDPNPYNAPKYQVSDLPNSLANELEHAPWRDTFFDGLISGYNSLLSDYYSIPICSVGGYRLFYNLDLLEKVKTFTLNEALKPESPVWILKLWQTQENPNGYLPQPEGIAWLKTKNIPQTLGQLFLYCHAVQAYAKANNQPDLVPIAGSNYHGNDIIEQYKPGFLSTFWEIIPPERGSRIHAMEMLAAYEKGVWTFHSPEFTDYLEFMNEMARFYPTGFLGLDREQATRRFVLGYAAIIQSGGWDASSILAGIAQRDNESDIFNVQIAPVPLPTEHERWSRFLTMRTSEANARGAVPLAINKQSPHFDHCLDFLKFVSSQRINEGFSQRAGWLPVISGAKAPESIRAFIPIIEGFPKDLSMDFAGDERDDFLTSIKNAWDINTKLFMAGDIGLDEMIRTIDSVLKNPDIGIRKSWIQARQKDIDRSRAYNQSVAVARFDHILGSDSALARERSTFSQNLEIDEGIQIEKWWHELHPGEPFPEY